MAGDLSFLKSLKPSRLRYESTDFWFELTPLSEGLDVRTVSKDSRKGINLTPDDYSGTLRQTLSLMESLADYPFYSGNGVDVYSDSLLAARLSECTNVVTQKEDQPIQQSHDPISRLILRIEPSEENEKSLKPKFLLRNSDESVTETFFMMSDSIVCDYKTFRHIESLGDNFAQLDIFSHEFPEDLLTDYLSVFLTYIRNVKIEIPGKKLVFGEPIECEPTIVIEKMDVDNALYLSACSTAPSDDNLLIMGLDATYYVRYNENGNLLASPLMFSDREQLTLQLCEIIKEYAPNRTERSYVYSDGSVIIVPEQTASAFLLEGLPHLLKEYKIVGLDRIKDFKLRPVRPRLNLRLSSGINFLEGNADVDIDGQKFTIRDLIEQYKANKYITLTDGTRAIIDSKFVKRIERIFGANSKGDKVRLSFFDLPEIEQYIEDQSKLDKALKRPREFYAGFNDLAKSKLSLPKIKATLRRYQSDGVKWLDYLYQNNMGGCLADDMGLGKTLQIICLLEKHLKKGNAPSLIVMPKSLLFNWESEFRKFAPHIDVCVYHGNNRNFEDALTHQVILTTYAMVRNDIEKFKDIEFECIVLDESQTIKNSEAQQTKAVAMLKSAHRFALSGTPIENSLGDLYSLFRFINPGMFGTQDDFSHRYLQPIQREQDDEALQSLRRKIFPFMLRRLKKDVLTDLPDRIDNTIYVDMSDEQARYYEQRRKYYYDRMNEAIATEGLNKAQFVMFQALSELRRIASVPESLTDGRISSPKLEMLIEQISQAVENGHKVVVFFNFVAGLEIMAERLNAMGIPTETITGATRDRETIVNTFQNTEDCKVLIMTLKTGGVGLNLTAADMVFIAEPWWNVAAQEQAINRLYRIGQKNTVFSYSLISRNTIEEKIEQLQRMKADLFNDVIASDESTSKRLTEEDINFILS